MLRFLVKLTKEKLWRENLFSERFDYFFRDNLYNKIHQYLSLFPSILFQLASFTIEVESPRFCHPRIAFRSTIKEQRATTQFFPPSFELFWIHSYFPRLHSWIFFGWVHGRCAGRTSNLEAQYFYSTVNASLLMLWIALVNRDSTQRSFPAAATLPRLLFPPSKISLFPAIQIF